MPEFIDLLRSQLSTLVREADQFEEQANIARSMAVVATTKAAKIKELLALYETEEELRPSPTDMQTVPTAATAVIDGLARLQASLAVADGRRLYKKNAMETAIESMLAGHRQIHRTAILESLMKQGIMGEEKNPMGQLAAFLSDNRHKFVSDGRGNFSLRRNGPPEPQPAPMAEAGNEAGGETVTDTAPPETKLRERIFPWAGSPATD